MNVIFDAYCDDDISLLVGPLFHKYPFLAYWHFPISANAVTATKATATIDLC